MKYFSKREYKGLLYFTPNLFVSLQNKRRAVEIIFKVFYKIGWNFQALRTNGGATHRVIGAVHRGGRDSVKTRCAMHKGGDATH